MSATGSVSQWIVQLKAGDREATRQLWEHYFRRLVGLARGKLTGRQRGADEEDVALSAFASFCEGAEQGRFPKLDDRDDLWRLLMVTGSVFTASADHTVQRRPLPAPVAGSPVRLNPWVQVITGMELDATQTPRWLEPAEWRRRRLQLDALGGPPLP